MKKWFFAALFAATCVIPGCLVTTPGMGTYWCDLVIDGPGYGHVACEHVEPVH